MAPDRLVHVVRPPRAERALDQLQAKRGRDVRDRIADLAVGEEQQDRP